MSAAIARLRGLLGGGRASAVDALAADLRALQGRVDDLQRHVHAIGATQDEARVRQLEDVDAIRASITTVADDLSERIAALHRASGPASEAM